MITYDEFKKTVEDNILSYMPKEYQHMKVCISSENVTNQTRDKLSLVDQTKESFVSPSIDIMDLYELYPMFDDMPYFLGRIAAIMADRLRNVPALNVDFSDPASKEKIVFQLVNTAQNADMLKDVPHREVNDLSVIYRWAVAIDEDGVRSFIIHNDIAEEIHMTEEELYQRAYDNTRKLFPPQVKTLADTTIDAIKATSGFDMVPDNIIESIRTETVEAFPNGAVPYVLSNTKGINGAAYILYDDELQSLAEKIGTDYYILPSSIHDVIAISSKNLGMDVLDDLANMVYSVNASAVELEERLSNEVYFYDKDTHTLSLATDTKNKRLDMEAEADLEME